MGHFLVGSRGAFTDEAFPDEVLYKTQLSVAPANQNNGRLGGPCLAGTTVDVVLVKEAFWADFVATVGEGLIGFITGQGDSGAVVAADLILGSMPGLGIYADGRDLVSELARFAPGGESPDYLVSSFALFGLATELPIFKGSADLVLNTAKVLLKQVSPAAKGLRTAIGRALGQAIQELDADAVLGFGPLMARMATDADFRHLSEGMVKVDKHLAELNQAASRYGTDEVAATLLKLQAEGIDAGSLQKAIGKLGSKFGPDVAEALNRTGKFELVARALARNPGEWREANVLNYTAAVDRLGASSDAIRDFDEVLDAKGASSYLNNDLKIYKGDFQFEIGAAAAAKRGGLDVQELSIKLPNDNNPDLPDGEIDYVALYPDGGGFAVEVSSGDPRAKLTKWIKLDQIDTLVQYAHKNALTPKVQFRTLPNGDILDQDIQEYLASYGVIWEFVGAH